ncbi:MAG TPA: glycosyltransferase family 9 protein [Vicinamibacterales bacterium]|nr:glycosyltransferase family 9 protein [Vicinamibacterales bacterium]
MTIDRPPPVPGRRIGIIRLTSLGDVIHTLPVAAAIRDGDPAAKIVWFAEEREQTFLRGNPVVDEVITVPLRRWRQQLASPSGLRRTVLELRELLRRLRLDPIDVAIDVQGWPHKTSPIVRATRAPIRIGFDRRNARHPLATLFTTHQVAPPPEAGHIVEKNLALLGPIGLGRVGTPRFPLPSFADADERAAAWLAEARFAREGGPAAQLVALLPSTRGRAKLWPASNYRELARQLLADPAVLVVILGGPGEEPLLEEVRSGLPESRAVVCAPGPIPELVGVIRRAQLAVGNDTGPLHVAAAIGVPSLGLFGPTRGARNGPYGAHCAYIQSPTGRMLDIPVHQVVAAVRQLRGIEVR